MNDSPLLQGQPLAYLRGHTEFMGVKLLVAPGALVPREETELLGHAALRALQQSATPVPRLIDMCCGSGNLACALAHHAPAIEVWASDLTDGCCELSRSNVQQLGLQHRVHIMQGDLFAALAGLGLEGSIDVIVCNPPYISQGKLGTELATLTSHEPREAFDGGPYGLSIHQRVIKDALPFLKPGGVLLFEIGLGQDRQVKMLFDRARAYDALASISNDCGQVRVVHAQKQAK